MKTVFDRRRLGTLRSGSCRSGIVQFSARYVLAPLVAVLLALVGPATPSAAAAQDSVPVSPRRPAVLLTPIYDGDATTNLAGGARQRTAYVGALSVTVRVDGRQLLGIPGASAFVYGLATHGGSPSDFVGDVQGVNNLEAPPALRLEEAWVQQNLLRNRLSILLGRYDLNTEFYRVKSATLFLNSSFGIGPEFAGSGQLGPSIYPRTALAARVEAKPVRNAVIRAAVLNGVPVIRGNDARRAFAPGDGALLVGEVALLSRAGQEGPRLNPRFRIGRGPPPFPYDGKLALGVWHYTHAPGNVADTLSVDATAAAKRPSTGAYLVGERTVWTARADTARSLTLFGQAGTGDPRLNVIARYLGGGLALTAPFAGRSGDVAGLAVAAAYNGSRFRSVENRTAASVGRAETTVEASYLAQLAGWLVVQPDLQYVIQPATLRGRPNALAASLRFEVAR